MTDPVCDHKVHIRAFFAKQDLPLTLLQPLVKLIKSVANDQRALSKWSISDALASYLRTHGIAAQYKTELLTKLQELVTMCHNFLL